MININKRHAYLLLLLKAVIVYNIKAEIDAFNKALSYPLLSSVDNPIDNIAVIQIAEHFLEEQNQNCINRVYYRFPGISLWARLHSL